MGRAPTELLAAAEAREPTLYAVALVALGDAGLARLAVGSTLKDLLREGRSLELQPGRFTRERLARHVLHLAEAEARAPGRPCELVALSRGPEVDPTTRVAADVLARLPATDRLALALVELDDATVADAERLAMDPHGSAQPNVARATEGLAAALADAGQATSSRVALDRLVDLLPWERHPPALDEVLGLRARTARRRLAAAVTGALVVGAAGWLAATRGGADPQPRPTPSGVIASGSGSIAIDGVRFTLAVPESAEGDLPSLPRAVGDLALPAILTMPQGSITPLTAGVLGDRKVRAVLVRRLSDGTGRAVLYVPRGTPDFVEVSDVVLPPLPDTQPGTSAVGPRTISDDRRSIVVRDTHGVAVVDTRTAAVTRIALPDGPGPTVGWSAGSDLVIVQSLSGQPYRLDPRTGSSEPMGPPGSASGRWIVATDRPNLLAFDDRGTLVSQVGLPGPIVTAVGATATSLTGWSATGAEFGTSIVPAGSTQGLYAVSVDLSPSAAALALRPEDRGSTAPCVALGWAPQDRLLYLAPSGTAWRILAWDVTNGQQFLVSTLRVPTGQWQGELAL